MSGKKQRMTTTMSPDKQRIAIAKACGWTYEEKVIAYIRPEPFKHWTDPDGEYLGLYDIPDYLYDLNAMAEAEKLFIPTHLEYSNNEGNWVEYAGHLSKIARTDDYELSLFCFRMITATAAQRAEAFLKTLNLWTDD